MRRFLVPIFVVLLAVVIESALLPTLFRSAWRPGLTLVVASIWAHLSDTDGAITAFAGGLALEATSGLPFGTNIFALMLGNGIAALVDRAPVPSALFRATNWVAVTTLVFHLSIIGIQTLRGVEIDLASDRGYPRRSGLRRRLDVAYRYHGLQAFPDRLAVGVDCLQEFQPGRNLHSRWQRVGQRCLHLG